jgi:hypothetical protein
LEEGDRGVASVGLLRQHYEGDIGIGTELGIVSAPNPGDDLAQAAPADPDVPAQHHETARPGGGLTGWRGGEIECDLRTDVAAPRVQAEPCVVIVARQAEISGVGQW